MELLSHLQQLEETGDPIRVGLVGCGQMGSGMMHITRKMPGMTTQAVADIDPNRPLKEMHLMGVPDSEIVITTNRLQAEDALQKGKYLVTEDAVMLATLEGLDILIEATGYTEIGAQVAESVHDRPENQGDTRDSPAPGRDGNAHAWLHSP